MAAETVDRRRGDGDGDHRGHRCADRPHRHPAVWPRNSANLVGMACVGGHLGSLGSAPRDVRAQSARAAAAGSTREVRAGRRDGELFRRGMSRLQQTRAAGRGDERSIAVLRAHSAFARRRLNRSGGLGIDGSYRQRKCVCRADSNPVTSVAHSPGAHGPVASWCSPRRSPAAKSVSDGRATGYMSCWGSPM